MFAQPLRALEFSTPRSPQRHCVLCIISPMSTLRHCISFMYAKYKPTTAIGGISVECTLIASLHLLHQIQCASSRGLSAYISSKFHHKSCSTCLQEMFRCSPGLLTTSLAVSIILIKSTDAGSFTCFRILQAFLHDLLSPSPQLAQGLNHKLGIRKSSEAV